MIYCECYYDYLMVKNAQTVYLLLLLSFDYLFSIHSITHPHNHAYVKVKNAQIVYFLVIMLI